MFMRIYMYICMCVRVQDMFDWPLELEFNLEFISLLFFLGWIGFAYEIAWAIRGYIFNLD